jgi:peptidoglycan/xylan/chitin deacetylase (PgdA/CDA1 family)
MISIVIPAFNEEKLLPSCLESLRNQDYKGKYEIIVADNGSTDATAEIAKSFGAKVIPCPEKKSVFYARQVGADAASGDIIVQADADTIYPSNWLKRIANQFASHPQVVAVAGRYIYRDPPYWAKVEYPARHFINRLTTALFGSPLSLSGATFAFRRRAFLLVNGYHGLSYSADQFGICRRLSKVGKVLYDRNLIVQTSARSVQKPLFFIMIDFLVHLGRWSAYFHRYCVSVSREFKVKVPARRTIIKVLPVVVLVIFISFAAYGYFIPASPVFGKVYYKGSSTENVVALTFDDGPNEPYTSEVLDILTSHHIKATFFVIGKNVELYPETARRILAEGDVIGNHSYSHDANHALTEYGAKDLQLAQGIIFNTVGVRPHLYCPPHGKKSPWELQAAKKDGMIEVTWSVSANDQHVLAYFGKPSPETFAREIVSETKPGEIILLHDGYGTSHDTAESDKSLTVKALSLIIEQLQAKGYRFVTVPQLLNVPAYNEALP